MGCMGSRIAIKGSSHGVRVNWFCVFFALPVLCPLPRLLKPTMICALPLFPLPRGHRFVTLVHDPRDTAIDVELKVRWLVKVFVRLRTSSRGS